MSNNKNKELAREIQAEAGLNYQDALAFAYDQRYSQINMMYDPRTGRVMNGSLKPAVVLSWAPILKGLDNVILCNTGPGWNQLFGYSTRGFFVDNATFYISFGRYLSTREELKASGEYDGYTDEELDQELEEGPIFLRSGDPEIPNIPNKVVEGPMFDYIEVVISSTLVDNEGKASSEILDAIEVGEGNYEEANRKLADYLSTSLGVNVIEVPEESVRVEVNGSKEKIRAVIEAALKFFPLPPAIEGKDPLDASASWKE